jgi:Fur family peroxide stress response transcriptional regulator
VTKSKYTDDLTLTRQRDAVLKVVRSSIRHLTANEIFDKAKTSLPGISFATVYNALRYLKDHGMIGEVRFGSNAARFDRRLSRHDHALCVRCNEIVDLDLPIPEGLIQKAAEHSKFEPGSIEFTLHGLCPKCRKRSSTKNPESNRNKAR